MSTGSKPNAARAAQALAAQEGERQRIALEYGEIGQSLTAVLLGLKRTADRAPDDLQDELRSVQDTIRASLDEVRQVARRLHPGVLEDLGLLSAMSTFGHRLLRSQRARRLDQRLPALGRDAELVLYRIAQESLTNIARHANASRVELSLTRERDGLVLRITDDGQGLDGSGEGAGIRACGNGPS